MLSIFVCFSCAKTQVIPTPPLGKQPYAAIPMQEKISTEDRDPYFTESTRIHSDYGARSITRNIIQDKEGNMWFASWEGIMGYDGKQFTNYTNKENLRRFHMFSALEDSKGGLWFGSIGAGLYRYDGKDFVNVTKKDGLPDDVIMCFMEDSKRNIWMGTEKGVVIYDGKTYKAITEENGLINGDVNSIVEDEKGRVYIGTRGVLQVYENGIFTEVKQTDGSSFYNVRTVIIDREERMWLGGNDGLWVIDGDKQIQLSKDFAGYIFEDSKGEVWVGSVGAGMRNWVLKKYTISDLPLTEFNVELMHNQEGQIFGIMEDDEGMIWFGHENGAGQLIMSN